MPTRDLVVVSNRGPRSFHASDDGAIRSVPSGGGMAGSLRTALDGSDATWVCCAMSDADRLAAKSGLTIEDGIRLVMVTPPTDLYRMAYDVISNSTLWFTLHGMFDSPRRPRLDRHWHQAWEGYRRLNAMLASAVATEAPDNAMVLVQDYHLLLVPGLLRSIRPDLDLVMFCHTPFSQPWEWRMLPTSASAEILSSMAEAACGFHTTRWEQAFLSCCDDVAVDAPPTFVAPLGPDATTLARRLAESDAIEAGERWDVKLAGRRSIVRTDRLEPSKNILRGLLAVDELLESAPAWRGEFVHALLVHPSRQGLAEYSAYATEVIELARRVNLRWSTPGWAPIMVDVADDPVRSLAALVRYDVLLVNPVRDGLNLVAKEGPLVNECDGALALSREAGAFDEMGGPAVGLNPFDVSDTAAALSQALEMESPDRHKRADQLREISQSRTPEMWLADQIAAGRKNSGSSRPEAVSAIDVEA